MSTVDLDAVADRLERAAWSLQKSRRQVEANIELTKGTVAVVRECVAIAKLNSRELGAAVGPPAPLRPKLDLLPGGKGDDA